MYEGALQDLIDEFGQLPGIGPKSAQRMAIHVLDGAVWGLWHAPLIAMGYEYEHQIPAALGIVLFTMFCMAFGTLLAWLRVQGQECEDALGLRADPQAPDQHEHGEAEAQHGNGQPHH